jgi:hypothetical protein
MSAESDAIRAALQSHTPGRGEYATVTAGDVRAVALTITSADPIVAALLKGTDPKQVGPGKTVHQKVDDLAHLLTLADPTAKVFAGPLSVDPTPKAPTPAKK